MNKLKAFQGVFVVLVLFISSFAILYLITEPIVQSAYQKGYERGNIECKEYEEPTIDPFGEFEITFMNESPNWTFPKCCYPSDCLPEALDNPENCTCTYPIYCSYIWNAS